MRGLTLTMLLCIAVLSGLFAQPIDFNNYHRLKCAGELPKDFTLQSLQKYEEAKKQIDNKKKQSQKKLEDQFYLENSYKINSVLLSGRVLFGDPVTNYLNKIKDNLLKEQPELRDKIRIYTLRSTEVNAFTTNDGVVFVTTGLLSQVENEAQIAYILCHEFVHYIKKHALNEYEESTAMVHRKGIYRNLSTHDVNLYQFQFSKDMEMEADLNGLETYKKPNYSLNVVEGVFNVLLYSYLPFDEVEFNKKFFENGSYIFPKTYTKEKLSPISAEEDVKDDKSTHPNIKKRKTAAMESISSLDNKGRVLFIQPREDFLSIQKICRYESCLLYLTNSDYEDATYSAYILLQNDSANLFLRKIVARGLYCLSMYHTHDETPEGHIHYSDIEGNSQQIFYFFDKLPDKDLNILALKYAWGVHQADPVDKDIKQVCNDLMHSLAEKEDLDPSSFESKYIETVHASVPDSVVTPTEPSSKYDKIKKKKLTSEVTSEYYKYAFVPYMKDTSFINTFKKIADDYRAKEDALKGKKKKLRETEEGLNERKGYALNSDSIIVVNPIYYKYDETSRNPVKYIASDEALQLLHNEIAGNASRLHLTANFIEGNKITESETDKFNDISLLNEWISEEADHPGFNMVNTSNRDFIALASKYPVKNFVWMGVIAVKEKRANHHHKSYFFAIVVNAKTGNVKMNYLNTVASNDSPSIQSQNIYYILQQIKAKRK